MSMEHLFSTNDWCGRVQPVGSAILSTYQVLNCLRKQTEQAMESQSLNSVPACAQVEFLLWNFSAMNSNVNDEQTLYFLKFLVVRVLSQQSQNKWGQKLVPETGILWWTWPCSLWDDYGRIFEVWTRKVHLSFSILMSYCECVLDGRAEAELPKLLGAQKSAFSWVAWLGFDCNCTLVLHSWNKLVHNLFWT